MDNPFSEIYGKAFLHFAMVMNWQLSQVDDELYEMQLATMLEF